MQPRWKNKCLGFKKPSWGMCVTSGCAISHLAVPCFAYPASDWLIVFPARESNMGRWKAMQGGIRVYQCPLSITDLCVLRERGKGLKYESRTRVITKILIYLQCTMLQVTRLFFSREIFLCGSPGRSFALAIQRVVLFACIFCCWGSFVCLFGV